LLPKEDEEEEEEEDPRAELVRRLLEYKMYKYASYELKDMEMDAVKAYYKTASIPDEVKQYKEEIDPAEVVGDTTLAMLNEIFNQVMKRTVDRVDPIRSKFGTIEKEEVRIEDKMDEIRTSVKGLKGINFRTLLEMQASKINIIVTFLAILELMKVGDIVIRQEELFGDIIIDSLELD
ncbi:MAG: segregation/condensation protein A, partial [Lachnospiraceae bacterium]|nr:segregation/condensation protein A [Lachnospiraceae bacterium]